MCLMNPSKRRDELPIATVQHSPRLCKGLRELTLKAYIAKSVKDEWATDAATDVGYSYSMQRLSGYFIFLRSYLNKNICSLLQELYALDVEAAEKSHYGTTSAHLPTETATY